MTSQVYGMCFVSVNGNNVFQDNHVKRRVVILCMCILYKYAKQRQIYIFYLRTPFYSEFNLVLGPQF